MSCEIRPLTSHERDALDGVRRLGLTAADHDGVSPFNEASLLALESLERARPGSGAPRGFIAFAGEGVVGAAIDAENDGSAIDLVVNPNRRRAGIGTALLGKVLAHTPGAALWAHGSSETAAHFAKATGLRAARSLWVMSRDVQPGERFDVSLPDGLVARPYDGSDEQARAWLAVNASSFATHPEQGRMTLEDFFQRRTEEWFDREGLILVWDENDSSHPPTLAASHWTKREPGSDVGEVYVVAVAPGYQGRGIARPLTNLGLRHLADAGVRRIELYVEGDNEPAKAAYTRVGFARTAGDTMYVPDTPRSEGTSQA